MQKQLGKIGTVRPRYAEPRIHDSEGTKINSSSEPVVPRESRVCVLSAAGVPTHESTAVPAKHSAIDLSSGALDLPESQACVLSTADVAIIKGPTTILEKHRGYGMTGKLNVSTIVAMPFLVWHAWCVYRARAQKRQNAIQMLARSCVVRPGDVGLRYITPSPKLGVFIGDSDTQTSHDMELSLYLEPLTASMRARGRQLLQWLPHELATTCMTKVWTSVAAGKRWWNLVHAQTKIQHQQEAQSNAIIRLLKTQRLQPW